MAYDIFPKNIEELKKSIKNRSSDVQEEIIILFDNLKKNFSAVETPINLDKSKATNINITRTLQEDVKIPKLVQNLKIQKIKLKFGNGSSGNRGVNNRGNLFEPQFAESLNNWWSGKKVTDSKMLSAIEDLNETYDLSNQNYWKIDIVGGENTPRPIVYSSKITISNPKGRGNDIGKSVTDITLTIDNKKEIYLSLKLGTTTTFFNLGVRKVIPPNDVKTYSIKGDGKKLLKLFGLDEKLFCDVFNGNLKKGQIKTKNLNSSEMTSFLKSGIGKGYHIIHKLSGKILSKKMNDKALTAASKIQGSSKIYYGGKTGLGKRVDIEMESGTYKFKLNIRDTQGKDGYPTRLMCDFTYK
jgi:hypothetical protein